MERLVFIGVVFGVVVMVALDLLVLEPALGHTYFFYLTVFVCVLAFLLCVRWVWRASNRRRQAKGG